jgi:hypothetical protein
MSSTLNAALEKRNTFLTRYAMHATLACKDRQNNQFVTGFTNYDRTEAHVEVVLIGRLLEFYENSWDGIPNGSTILVYGSFSPCQECATSAIPYLIQQLKPAGRNIRVRFLFDNYYTQANWNAATNSASSTDTKKMWPSDQAAQTAYDNLRDNAGSLTMKESGFFDGPSNTATVFQKWPWALEIRPVGSASQSVIAQFTM